MNKYRPCKDIREFYNLVFSANAVCEENTLILKLIHGISIHFRLKEDKTEFYSFIVNIIKDNDKFLIAFGSVDLRDFNEFFDDFEIKINDKWQPFGVEIKR